MLFALKACYFAYSSLIFNFVCPTFCVSAVENAQSSGQPHRPTREQIAARYEALQQRAREPLREHSEPSASAEAAPNHQIAEVVEPEHNQEEVRNGQFTQEELRQITYLSALQRTNRPIPAELQAAADAARARVAQFDSDAEGWSQTSPLKK